MMESRSEECSVLIKKEFPAIDEDLFQYISGKELTESRPFDHSPIFVSDISCRCDLDLCRGL